MKAISYYKPTQKQQQQQTKKMVDAQMEVGVINKMASMD